MAGPARAESQRDPTFPQTEIMFQEGNSRSAEDPGRPDCAQAAQALTAIGYAAGSVSLARSPRPGRLLTAAAPPCRADTSLTKFRPRPVLFLPVSGRSREKNF